MNEYSGNDRHPMGDQADNNNNGIISMSSWEKFAKNVIKWKKNA